MRAWDGPDTELDALERAHMTRKLYNRLKRAQLDYNPVLNAQDCDESWLETLVIESEERMPGVYRVSYSDGYGTTHIHLRVEVGGDGCRVSEIYSR